MVGSRWIYKVNPAADRSVEKDKALFVANEFSQKEVIDYEETFTHVSRYYSIWTIISLTTKMGWRVHQMGVKTTFLNRVIQEDVFIEQPEGFDVENR